MFKTNVQFIHSYLDHDQYLTNSINSDHGPLYSCRLYFKNKSVLVIQDNRSVKNQISWMRINRNFAASDIS